MRWLPISCFSLFLLNAQETVWAPKAKQLTPYSGPHRPHVRLEEVKKRNAGRKGWTEVVMDDEHLHAAYVAMPAGVKTRQRFHPDTREWWYVLEGGVRFQIEGQEPFTAGKGWMVQAPPQTKFFYETVGAGHALFLEVNVAGARILYPGDTPQPIPPMPGFDWIQVRMPRKPLPYDKVNQPYRTFDELAAAPRYDSRGLFVQPVVADDRGAMNFIYGHEKNMAPLNPKDVGHYHPECAEAWLIAKGQMRYPIEGHGLVIAGEGDFVYVPRFRWHAPRFHGEGPSCRISLNGYPRISHLGAHQRSNAAYAANPDNVPSWQINSRSVEWKTPTVVSGDPRIAFVAHLLGRRLAYTQEIVELVPGERLVMRTAEGPFPMETTYRWRPATGARA